MQFLRDWLGGVLLLGVFSVPMLRAQTPPGPSEGPTFRTTSRLVFLDVTVLDNQGRPVVKGLTKNDFSLTESKKPQPIFSFDAPDARGAEVNTAAENSVGQAPVTIFVLDLLNSRFEDFAYIRSSVRQYLAAQPAQLSSPSELMVLGNQSLEMVQGYTRNKADLLSALAHVPAALPYKLMSSSFYAERFGQSIDALQQIALQNQGVPGRKNIVWIGHGGPGVLTEALPGSVVAELNQYVHDTTNLLVNARMALFVIYPGLQVRGSNFHMSELSANADLSDDNDPFAGDINFGVFVNETGGNLFYNRNDMGAEIQRSLELGSQYYTLTYQPPVGRADGKFRRVRVTLRDPALRVVTKAGYFAPTDGAPVDGRQQTMVNLAEASRSTLAFQALDLTIEKVVRHPDRDTAEFTVLLKSKNLLWQAADAGKSTTNLMLAAVSLSANRDILASRLETFTVQANTQEPTRLAATLTPLSVTLRVPRRTQSVRVVVQTAENGRLGTVELDSKTLDAAPETPTPEPKLVSRPPAQTTPPAPPPSSSAIRH